MQMQFSTSKVVDGSKVWTMTDSLSAAIASRMNMKETVTADNDLVINMLGSIGPPVDEKLKTLAQQLRDATLDTAETVQYSEDSFMALSWSTVMCK